jgi:hypothetical protein
VKEGAHAGERRVEHLPPVCAQKKLPSLRFWRMKENSRCAVRRRARQSGEKKHARRKIQGARLGISLQC